MYNLSDDATEFQILDRHSFGRFLGLHISQKVPDATTIWRFREDLVKAGIVEELFATFDAHLRDNGFMAMKGQIVDASIVSVPKQRNSREENARIKEGDIPEDWSENKRRRKDADARWTKKNGKSYYGYKNHISVDVKHKLIRSYAVTDAACTTATCSSNSLPTIRARTSGRIRPIDPRIDWSASARTVFASTSNARGAAIVP